MKEATKSTVLRVFQTAQCSSARYIWGVACSAASILLSGLPFNRYTYRPHLSGSVLKRYGCRRICCMAVGGYHGGRHRRWHRAFDRRQLHLPLLRLPCALWPAYAYPRSHGQAGPGLLHGRAVRRSTKGHERQHRENGKHYCPRCIEPHWRRPFAGLPVGAAVLHQCTARLDDRCRVGACVHHSVFGFWREAGAEDLDGSQPLIYGNGRGIFRVCVRDGRRKDLWQAGGRGFAADQLDRKKSKKT